MEVLYNYSRRINLTFLNEETGAQFKIECPSKGRKPNIQISGTLLPVDYMSDVEIRVINLYIDRGQTFQKVRVEAGYENSMSVAFEGEITNIYDESPGPEKVTVINCVQCKVKNMLSNVIALNLEKGFTLNSALSQITKAAELDAPEIVFSDVETCASAFTFNGTVQEALHQLAPLFPEVTLMFTDRTIKAVKQEISPTERAKVIKFLQSPPQVTGTVVIIKAPFDPAIKPGDVVTVQNVSYLSRKTISVGTLMNQYRINSVEFRFSTVQGSNQMTLQGYYPEGAK